MKFYFHISKEVQLEKLRERLDNPAKNWKHNAGDWEEHKFWDEYMRCYQDAINKTMAAPWEIVPADKRWYRDHVIANRILEELQAMDPKLPVLDDEKK